MTLGAERIILRDGAHIRIDRPEFAELRALVTAARELVEQPTDGVRVSRSDLGLWAELADLGIVDAQASAWTRAALALRDLTGLPEVEPDGRRRAAALPARRLPLAGVPVAQRARRDPGRRHGPGQDAADPGPGRPRPRRGRGAVPRGGPDLAWWRPGRTRPPTFVPGLTTRTVTESRARRGVGLDEAVAGADLVVTSYTLYRMEAAEYAARAWGGLVLDEAQTVKNHEGKTYQAVRRLDVPFRRGADRHPDGEPAHGAVVAALDRRARPLRLPRPVPRGGGQPGREGGRRAGARPVPAPDPTLPAAPHQGPGGARPAAEAGAGPRGDADARGTGRSTRPTSSASGRTSSGCSATSTSSGWRSSPR